MDIGISFFMVKYPCTVQTIQALPDLWAPAQPSILIPTELSLTTVWPSSILGIIILFLLEHMVLSQTFFPSSNTNGLTDRFTDTAFDTQYQFVGQKHIFTAQTTWVHERQDWNASFALGNTANSFNNLDSFKINCNYYYRTTIGTVGGTIRYFTISGSNDSLLYSPSPVSGSDSGNPDSRGFLFELDYLPTDYIKLAAQYIVYGKFNGGQSNYDGFGKNASDNNTFYLLVWLTY
ncbi:MAG: hypothetical protein AB2L12_07240 [Smithellaceae bacterium]